MGFTFCHIFGYSHFCYRYRMFRKHPKQYQTINDYQVNLTINYDLENKSQQLVLNLSTNLEFQDGRHYQFRICFYLYFLISHHNILTSIIMKKSFKIHIFFAK